MSVVSVVATKGGAGKSTIAVHVAVAAALRKRRPLIIDFDTNQTSILVWAKALRRKAKAPAIVKGSVDTLDDDIAAARRKYDLIIIDVAAGGGPLVQRLASISDHVLVPVRGSVFDIGATRNAVDLLRATADNTQPEEIAYRNALGKAAIVINGAPRKQTAKWRQDFETALSTCGAGGIPIVGCLAEREAYSASIEHGQGVTEDADDEKAVEEVLGLYQGLLDLEKDRERKLRKARGRK